MDLSVVFEPFTQWNKGAPEGMQLAQRVTANEDHGWRAATGNPAAE